MRIKIRENFLLTFFLHLYQVDIVNEYAIRQVLQMVVFQVQQMGQVSTFKWLEMFL